MIGFALGNFFLGRAVDRFGAVALVASGNYLSGAIWPMVLAGMLQDSGWHAAYAVRVIVT